MKVAITKQDLNEMVDKVYSLLNENVEQEIDAWEGVCTDDEEEPGLVYDEMGDAHDRGEL